MGRPLNTRSKHWVLVCMTVFLASGCSRGPVTDDALLTNHCDVTVLAAVIDASELETAVPVSDYARLAPAATAAFTRPNFDGSFVRVSVLLDADHMVYTFEDREVRDIGTVVDDAGKVLYDVVLEGDLCPSP